MDDRFKLKSVSRADAQYIFKACKTFDRWDYIAISALAADVSKNWICNGYYFTRLERVDCIFIFYARSCAGLYFTHGNDAFIYRNYFDINWDCRNLHWKYF